MKIRHKLLFSNLVVAFLVAMLGLLAVGSITGVEREFQALSGTGATESGWITAERGPFERLVSRSSRQVLLVAVAVALLAVAVGVGSSRSIIGRVERLQGAAIRYGRGDDPEALPVTGRDELCDLAAALNRMAADLRASRLEIVQGRDFLSEIINSMANSLVVLDAEGKILLVNAATHALLGYEDELGGLPFTLIMPDAPLQEVMERGILWNEEATYRTSSGTTVPVAFSCSVLWHADATLRGYVCVALEISAIKEAEAQLKRFADELQVNNEELRNFAYIVSHDLRAPLVNIRGFSGELQHQLGELQHHCARGSFPADDQRWLEQVFWPESAHALEFIGSSVARMDGLIASLLKLSRYGHRELNPELIDTRELVQGILATLSHQIGERGATVTVGTMLPVVADRPALEQIFANLLDNAVKYLEPERPGLIRVDAEESDDTVTFRVSDNGRGIAAADQEKIFDLFRRTGRLDVPGEGMGLAYVRTLVKRLAGQIWCESVPGEGTTFLVRLSLKADLQEMNE